MPCCRSDPRTLSEAATEPFERGWGEMSKSGFAGHGDSTDGLPARDEDHVRTRVIQVRGNGDRLRDAARREWSRPDDVARCGDLEAGGDWSRRAEIHSRDRLSDLPDANGQLRRRHAIRSGRCRRKGGSHGEESHPGATQRDLGPTGAAYLSAQRGGDWAAARHLCSVHR